MAREGLRQRGNIHPEFRSAYGVSVVCILRHLGDYSGPFKRVPLQRKVGPIKIQHVKEDIRKNNDRADQVNRPPKSRAMIGPKIG